MKKTKSRPAALAYFNLFMWVMGSIYIGELIVQLLTRSGLKIPDYDTYIRIQLYIFLPMGVAAYLATKAKLSRMFTALFGALALNIINFSSILKYTFEEPLEYVKQNQEEIMQAFIGNTIHLLPLLIGFVGAKILISLAPVVIKKINWNKVIEWIDLRNLKKNTKTVQKAVKNLKKKTKKNTGSKSTKKRKKK